MKLGITSKGSGISQIATAGALCALRESAIVPNFAVATGLFSYIMALFSIYDKDEDIIKRLDVIKPSILKLSKPKQIEFILFPKLATHDFLYKTIKREISNKNSFLELDVNLAITSADILTSQGYVYSAQKISAPNMLSVTDEELHKAIRYSLGGCGLCLPFYEKGRYMACSSASTGVLLSSMGADKTLEIEVVCSQNMNGSHIFKQESQKQDRWRADCKITIDVSDIDFKDKNVVEKLFNRGKDDVQKLVGDLLFSLYI